jgi:hypothetical protein
VPSVSRLLHNTFSFLDHISDQNKLVTQRSLHRCDRLNYICHKCNGTSLTSFNLSIVLCLSDSSTKRYISCCGLRGFKIVLTLPLFPEIQPQRAIPEIREECEHLFTFRIFYDNRFSCQRLLTSSITVQRPACNVVFFFRT